MKRVADLLEQRPKTNEDCFILARKLFEKFFHDNIVQVNTTYPKDLKMKDGTPFWKLPKKRPDELKFDKNNETHASFVKEVAKLFYSVYKQCLEST